MVEKMHESMINKWSFSLNVFEADEINAKLKINPWQGHRDFAYDLIKFLAPKNIVELGTHYGCSFFAFCQAVKDFDLKTELYAVDSWAGDPHAGYYSEDVYKLVKTTIDNKFSSLRVTLIREYFKDALFKFEDSSVDVIHIDGFHEYEAVKEDYNNWLPKLQDDGIMLFHDIAEYTKYGSSVFWGELKNLYDHIEFRHSWGLGILFPKGNRLYKKIIDSGFLETKNLYEKVSNISLSAANLQFNLEWQKDQADKHWRELQIANNDLKWQKDQADKHWRELQAVSEDLKNHKIMIDNISVDLCAKQSKLNMLENILNRLNRKFFFKLLWKGYLNEWHGEK